MNRDLKNHQVQVMHKYVDGSLAVGRTFEFASGAAYQVQRDGSVRTTRQKLSKAERKQVKRARRLDRNLSTANLCQA